MRIARILAFTFVAAALAAAPARAAEGHGGGGEDGGQAPASRQERLTSAQSYLPVPTLSAVVLQRYEPSGTFIVDMGIDVQNADLRRRATLNAPRLQDALRTALSTYANVYYRLRTEPDPTTITRLFQTAVDRTLGVPGAQVLLVNIIYQRGQTH
ncbi:MAG: hypothetical protein QM759_13615 [Terricaulis sp.]